MARRTLMGLALAVTLAVAWSAPASAAQTVFGYNDRAIWGSKAPAVADLAQETGAQAYRLSVEWAAVERQPGVWQWEEYDARYRKIVQAGLRPVIILRSAPFWAQETTATTCLVTVVAGAGCGRPPARGHLGAWAEFARRAARRYPEALGLEIFNEPNVASNWQPTADPDYYAQVLRVAYDAIKGVRPGLPVVSGGIAPLTDNGASIDAERFLRAFYAAGGRGAMDAIGIHPYSFPLGPSAEGSYYHRFMRAMREIRDGAGDSRTPFWITEFGYHTGPKHLGGVPPAVQASFVPGVIRLALNEPDVDVALLHSLVDFGTDPNLLGNKFGLLDTNLVKRPAFIEVVRAVPPSLEVTSAPASIRSSCPKKKKGAKACRRGGSVKIELWKASAVTASITARKRRGLKVRRQLRPGAAMLPLSGRVRGKAMRPGRYTLTVRASDRFGNESDPLRRKIRIR
jgi:hypothetical protein